MPKTKLIKWNEPHSFLPKYKENETLELSAILKCGVICALCNTCSCQECHGSLTIEDVKRLFNKDNM